MRVGRLSQLWRYPVKSMAGEVLEQGRIDKRVGIPGDRGWAVRDERAGEIRGAKKIPELLQLAARYLREPEADSTAPVEIRLPDGRVVDSDAHDVSAILSAALGTEVTLCARRPADDLDHYRRARRIEDPASEIRRTSELLPDEPLPALGDFPPELLEFVSPPGTYFDAFELHLLTRESLAELARRAPGATLDARRFRPNLLVDLDATTQGFPEFDWCGRELRIGNAIARVLSPVMRCRMTTHAQAELPRDPRIMRALVRETQMNLGVGLTVIEPGTVRAGDALELL
jgi:uncharacterized protein YcbX